MAANSTTTTLRKAIEAKSIEFIKSFEVAWEEKNPALINRSLDAACKRVIAPASYMQSRGVPADFALTNEMYAEYYAKDLKVSRVVGSKVSFMVIDTEERKSAFTSASDIEYNDGEKAVLEVAWYLQFNDDASKITKVLEFVDADSTTTFINKCRELEAKLEGGQS